MFEKHKVIVTFRADVLEHLVVIRDEVRKGKESDAMLFFGELLNMLATWKKSYERPVFAGGSFATGYKSVVDPNEIKGLARTRIGILEKAIAEAEGLIKAKGWKI